MLSGAPPVTLSRMCGAVHPPPSNQTLHSRHNNNAARCERGAGLLILSMFRKRSTERARRHRDGAPPPMRSRLAHHFSGTRSEAKPYSNMGDGPQWWMKIKGAAAGTSRRTNRVP